MATTTSNLHLTADQHCWPSDQDAFIIKNLCKTGVEHIEISLTRLTDMFGSKLYEKTHDYYIKLFKAGIKPVAVGHITDTIHYSLKYHQHEPDKVSELLELAIADAVHIAGIMGVTKLIVDQTKLQNIMPALAPSSWRLIWKGITKMARDEQVEIHTTQTMADDQIDHIKSMNIYTGRADKDTVTNYAGRSDLIYFSQHGTGFVKKNGLADFDSNIFDAGVLFSHMMATGQPSYFILKLSRHLEDPVDRLQEIYRNKILFDIAVDTTAYQPDDEAVTHEVSKTGATEVKAKSA